MSPRTDRHTAPRLPELLLNLCLAPEDRFALTGDLNEEYLLFVRPARGRIRANLWYWRQVVTSLGPSLGRRMRRRPRRRPKRPRRIGDAMIHGLWQDIRFAARSLRKRLGFTTLAVATLALGIGTNIAIFSTLNPFLFRSLPFEDPQRLVHLFGVIEDWEGFGGDQARIDHATFADVQDQATSYEELGAYTYAITNITGGDEPEHVTAGYVTDNMFNILGVQAALGRRIVPGDGEESAERVVVLSDGLWRRSFGADPDIVGKAASINKNVHTVIGVMPAGFNFPYGGVRMWIPYRIDRTAERGQGSLLGVGRLEPGVSKEAAHAEIAGIANRLKSAYPASNENKGMRAVGLREGLIFLFDLVRLAFLALAASVALVLLIGCANVANLVLAWGTAREREIAVRTAMGAGRWRIIRQLLTENALLALIAGTLGTVIAILAVRPIAAVMPGDLWRAGAITVDGAALAFALIISLGTVLLFGLVPALQTTRTNLTDALKEGGRSGSEGTAGRRLSNLLVVGEISMAMFLLLGAALLIKSVDNMTEMDIGLESENVLTAKVTLPRADYQNDSDVLTLVTNTLEQLSAASTVSSAAAVYPLPMNFETMGVGFTIDALGEEPDDAHLASGHWATPDYFRTMRIPVMAGRGFTAQDTENSPTVVAVNKALAERYWPDANPVGQRLTLHDPPAEPTPATVVGVVGDVIQGGLYDEIGPQVYFPWLQDPSRGFYLTLATETDALDAVPTLRGVVWGADPTLPISAIRSMDEVVTEALGPFQGMALVLALLAGGALVLAAGGIYGVIAYSVSRRIHEFGVRTALGASGRHVIRQVVGQGARLTVIGVGIGMGLAFASGRLVSNLLYGIAPADAATFIGTPLFLTAVALLATYIPARRATRVDPMEALRGE
jgi:putative ABC transport system permease protein